MFEIRIKPNSITILKNTMLYDADGNPVSVSKERVALGAGDNAADPTNITEQEKADFKAAIKTFASPVLEDDVLDKIIESKVSQDELREAKRERDQLKVERDDLIRERDARNKSKSRL